MTELERTITSNEVAEMVGRPHNDVMKDIRRIVIHLGEGKNSQSYFIESTYINSQNKELPNFLLSKKGCELYSTRMTGEKGTQFAVAYIERFNDMEIQIKQERPLSQLSYREQALLALAANEETNERVDKVEQDLKEIKDNALITTEDKNAIDRLIKRTVYTYVNDHRLGKKAKSMLFQDLGRSLKELFNVPHRGRIKEKHYQSAVDFISTWEPTSVTKAKINQLEFELEYNDYRR